MSFGFENDNTTFSKILNLMGNKIQSPLVGLEANLIADIHHSRLVKADIESIKGVSFPNCISIPEFKRMEDW
jgi:hypothetical protein